MRKWLTICLLATLLLPLVVGVSRTMAATGDPVLINEVLASHSGTDDTEFVELFGTSGYSLSGLSLIVVEGDAFGPGAIDRRFDFKPFHKIGPNGFFLFGNCGGLPAEYGVTPDASLFNNYFENSSLTVALVETASISGDSVSGSEIVLDAVALNDGDAGDTFYFGAPVIGPDGTFFPAGARRLVDGVDTDTADDWMISSFFLPGDNTPTGGGFDGCAPIPLTIPEIQGDGQVSDYQGEVVITEGIVTVDLQRSSELKGFFIQDRFGDGDPATSDGLFINHSDYWSPTFDPSVGDLVRVQGTIDEKDGRTQMEWLEWGTVCDTGYQPVATNVFARDFNANAEAYEGMYVRFPRPMAATDTYNLHRYGEVWLAEKGVVEQPTNEYPVGPNSAALAEDNLARSVLLDDGSTWSNPDPVPYTRQGGTLRLGDTAHALVGAIDYAFGNYRIQPQDPASVRFVPKNARPGEPKTYGGNLVVASANVLNYWTTLDGRGASTPEQLAVQTEKLVGELLGTGADIIGLQEIENDPEHTPILTLVEALNVAEGDDVWSWIGPHDANTYPIRNEIIYRNDRVETVGTPVTVEDPIFDNIPPGRTDPIGRRPVAQTFKSNGETFTVVSNHFKSKGCSGASDADEDQGDGQSCFNATRVGQAERVLELVDDLIEHTGDPDVIVVGDLNAYLEEDPILTLETELVNLVPEWDKDPYSYNFFATFAAPWIGRGLLDYALATPSMAKQVKRAEVWHINADEPRFLDWYDPDLVAPGPYRASDHDPVIVSLKIK